MTPDEIKQLRKNLEAMTRKHSDEGGLTVINPNKILFLLDTIDRLKMQNELLIKAMNFYADITSYHRIDIDLGERARQALDDCAKLDKRE